MRLTVLIVRVVHGDLKPGNIFLVQSGRSSDYDHEAVTSVQTTAASGDCSGAPSNMPTEAPALRRGTILGTLQYMAPEQLEGKEADARTDIFAFGTVLYEMVTGRRAFHGNTQVSLLAAIIEHDPPLISSLQPLSPANLDDLVKTCVAKSPDNRWQSMRDVLLQLKLIADRHGMSATTTALTGRATRRLRLAWAARLLCLLRPGRRGC